MSVIVVVDGGGSGCRLAAYDAAGAQLLRTESGPANLTLGADQAWLNIRNGLHTLAEQLNFADTQHSYMWLDKLVMGLAGSLQRDRRERFCALIPEGIEYRLTTDGEAQLLGASGGQSGVCAALGTGSVVHWREADGSMHMAGGWGFPAGDEASGTWLGLHAVRSFIAYLDEVKHRGSRSAVLANNADYLHQSLQQKLGLNTSDVQIWSTCANPTQLATLAPLVIDAAAQGSDAASAILDDGVKELEKLIALAPDELPLYLVGGVAHAYHERLVSRYGARLSCAKGDALDGLYSIAMEDSKRDSADNKESQKC